MTVVAGGGGRGLEGWFWHGGPGFAGHAGVRVGVERALGRAEVVDGRLEVAGVVMFRRRGGNFGAGW